MAPNFNDLKLLDFADAISFPNLSVDGPSVETTRNDLSPGFTTVPLSPNTCSLNSAAQKIDLLSALDSDTRNNLINYYAKNLIEADYLTSDPFGYAEKIENYTFEMANNEYEYKLLWASRIHEVQMELYEKRQNKNDWKTILEVKNIIHQRTCKNNQHQQGIGEASQQKLKKSKFQSGLAERAVCIDEIRKPGNHPDKINWEANIFESQNRSLINEDCTIPYRKFELNSLSVSLHENTPNRTVQYGGKHESKRRSLIKKIRDSSVWTVSHGPTEQTSEDNNAVGNTADRYNTNDEKKSASTFDASAFDYIQYPQSPVVGAYCVPQSFEANVYNQLRRSEASTFQHPHSTVAGACDLLPSSLSFLQILANSRS